MQIFIKMQNISTTTAASICFGFQLSPDITIEFVKPKSEISCSENVSDHRVNDDEVGGHDDYDSYFNPLIYCAITMGDDQNNGEILHQDGLNLEGIDLNKTETASKAKRTMKNSQSNENSSFVCNGGESGSNGKIKKRFSCHICQKTFGWTTDLKRHILIHTGERPFKCSLCFATFTRNFLLQKHKTKIHQCLSPNEISQLNNNVAKNLMEIKLKMRELEQAKVSNVEDEKIQ